MDLQNSSSEPAESQAFAGPAASRLPAAIPGSQATSAAPLPPAPRPSLWPFLALLLLAGAALAVFLPPPKTNTQYSNGGRSMVARIRGDHRTMTIALETYYLDQNAYPAWTSGSEGANAFAPPASQSYKVPTFRIKRDKSDPLITLTTPVAYITTYFADPYADVRGATFGYWSPLPGQGKGVGYIIWSPGPDGISEIDPEADYNPSLSNTLPSLVNKTYDPSNGTLSRGDVYRTKQ